MSWWTVAWFGWLAYFAAVEAMALVNSRSGDTLSEHVWSFLGLRNPREIKIVPTPAGPVVVPAKRITGWTKVRRTAVGLFMLALAAHFLIGSDPLGNTVLIATSVLLAAAVLGTGAVRFFRRSRGAPPQTKESPHGNIQH